MKFLRAFPLLLLAVSITALVAACGDAAGGEDSQQDSLCPDQLTMCGEFCTELDTSFDHCGSCGNVCPEGGQCNEGVCECPTGFQDFEGTCVSDDTAEWICSAEANDCRDGEVCAYGMCAPNEMVAGVVKYTNEARREGYDCYSGYFGPTQDVSPNRFLHEAAQVHSEDMSAQADSGVSPDQALDHTGSDGSDFSTRIRRTDYRGSPGGENLAYGYATPEEAVDGWLSSTTGHCANLMNPDVDEIGVGYVDDGAPGSPWWTQVFGAR
ncbi:MAG: CAP domain-containing protein [Myxococcota bacterium]